MIVVNKRFFYRTALKIALPIAFVAGLLSSFAVRKENLKPLDRIRVGTLIRTPSLALDPVTDNYLQEMNLLSNLYGQLVTLDNKDNLAPSVASSFSWRGNDLVFRFDRHIKTRDGSIIDAMDAVLSLKRILVLQSDDQTLRKLLCPSSSMRSIDETCEGIRLEGETLVLRPTMKHQGPILLALLAAIDYSVIPKANIDLSKKGYPLIGHRNTSGAYYIEKDNDRGAWVLKANEGNPVYYSKDIPQTVELIPVEYSNAVEALASGKIDVLPSDITPDPQGADGWGGHKQEYNFHNTLPLRVNMIGFSPSAVREFSIEQRLHAARILKEVYLKDAFTPEDQDTIQFFQGYSEASLDKEQLQRIAKLREPRPKPLFQKPIRFSVISSNYEKATRALKDYPEIKVVKNRDYAAFLPQSERLDMYSSSAVFSGLNTWMIFNNLFDDGMFHLPGLDSEAWLNNYFALSDENLKLKMVRSLHEQLLNQVIIYPVKAMIYTVAMRKPWKPHFSTLKAYTPFWKIRYDP